MNLRQIKNVIDKYQNILDNIDTYRQLNDNDKKIIKKVLNLILKHLIPIYDVLKTPKFPVNFSEKLHRATDYILYVYSGRLLDSYFTIIIGLLANISITKSFYVDELLPFYTNYQHITKYYATITKKGSQVKHITNLIELINYILMDESSYSIANLYPYLKNLTNYLLELVTYINNNDKNNINKMLKLLLKYLQSYKNDDYIIPTITHLVNIECYKLIIPKSTSITSNKAKSLTFSPKTSKTSKTTTSSKKVKSY
jgi:hypothetical protein